ncbi:MAG TPA: prolyl oligopeptidase family serine peptidase, partial [Vicinamibacterales bacterium]|nr:prolyl oligopeptidase family serine peptidase [Vicinamibacterales bacterium]
MHMRTKSFVTALAVTLASVAVFGQQYPKTRATDHVDTYHGVAVPDPYRWLEDDTSAETAAWVEAQNRITFGYLSKIPFRRSLTRRVIALNNYEKISAPSRKGAYVFFSRNAGLQNQSVLYVQRGMTGKPEVLIDPNTWSKEGTTRLVGFTPSNDARYAAYGVSQSGSDWQEFKVMELATRKILDDRVEWVKVSGVAWQKDGFYYSRYPAPEKGQEKASINENHQVYFHQVGTPQSQDALVYEDKDHAQRFHNVSTTDDERFAILTISERGQGKNGNAVFVRDLEKGDRDFKPLMPEIGNDSYGVVDNVGGMLLVETDYKAPNGRVILVDPARPEEANWKTILAEKPEPLQGSSTAGGKLFATYLKDVTTRAYVHALDGTLEHEIVLPGPGNAGGFGGERDTKDVFYTFNSLNVPPTIYRYDIATKRSRVFRAPKVPGYDPARYETKSVFYSSKDGTKVPMFLVHRKGLKLDGTNPTLLYGYGGFNVVQSPSFSAARLALLEQGFVYANANMRGGGEYGETWHQAGTKLQKQNVFDDFIAAAEWLIANKYTSTPKLAIQGGSNGGLLVGAVVNQRPDLFGVAIPQVGVMDMLRFHKFTIGWNWVADYGSSDNKNEFAALHKYSPLHNIAKGVKYPPTLITTADHDDRVVPAHSFKYAATLQERASHDTPLLIRIDTKSGHGASSLTKALETTADIYAFIMHNMGVTPR